MHLPLNSLPKSRSSVPCPLWKQRAPLGWPARAGLACWVAFSLALPGCATRPSLDLVIGPEYHPSNVYGQKAPLPRDLRRVALLPVSGEPAPEVRAMLGAALDSELAKTKRFELVPVSPELLQTWTGQNACRPSAALPLPLAAHLRQELGCDGVLLSELTEYRSYPPLVVGWSLKLVDLHSGQIVWAADERFDGGQTAVANGARRYRLRHSQFPGSLEDSRFILLSPKAFGQYTANALFATLPACPGPEHSAKVSPAPADKKRGSKDHLT